MGFLDRILKADPHKLMDWLDFRMLWLNTNPPEMDSGIVDEFARARAFVADGKTARGITDTAVKAFRQNSPLLMREALREMHDAALRGNSLKPPDPKQEALWQAGISGL